MTLTGRVIEEQKSYFMVDTIEGIFRASIRGILKKNKTRICTGDLVNIEITNQIPPEGIISSVYDRSSYLKRPAVANLSQVFFITTLSNPPLDLEALDRFLFSAEAYHLKAILVFNKTDILTTSDFEKLDSVCTLYDRIGYPIIKTSAISGTGIKEIIDLCKDQISAFAGLSGVGKSSLLSKIFPDKQLRIGNVSGATGRGTHTTTFTSLLRLEAGGYIADTPGLSFVEIPRLGEEDVITCFPELLKMVGHCRFNDCIHSGEPGCIISEMVEQKEIADTRHCHYLKIYQEMKQLRKQYH